MTPHAELSRSKSSVSVADVPDVSSSRVFEVEKKIELPKGKIMDFEAKIIAFGGSLSKREQFTDTYYDTEDLILTASNHYLRQRNGRWELKIPMPGDTFEASVFEELEDEDDITEFFETKFPVPIKLPFTPHSLPKAMPLTEFMTFTTKRSKWKIEDISIDIDEACFGFSLAEFEVLCDHEAQVPKTLERIESMCSMFGIECKDGPQGLGKMEKYVLNDHTLCGHVMQHAPGLVERFL